MPNVTDILTNFFHCVETIQLDLQGPVFSQEPPHKIEFSNSTGGHIECSGHGSPQPEVGLADYNKMISFCYICSILVGVKRIHNILRGQHSLTEHNGIVI